MPTVRLVDVCVNGESGLETKSGSSQGLCEVQVFPLLQETQSARAYRLVHLIPPERDD
jgi:hypothetical protein